MRQWTLNEDIYILDWYARGISAWHVAHDIERSEKAVVARMKFLQSSRGQSRAKIAEKVGSKLGNIAREIVALEDMGFDIAGWLSGWWPDDDRHNPRPGQTT